MSDNKKIGTLLAPNYYKSFKCIASRCRHSCCIDWEICIDSATHAKYMQYEDILGSIEESEGDPCFKLREDGRCPHLDDSGLCGIILAYGEELLCDICRNHPRFFNCVGGGRVEAGLGIVCEEACRLILEYEEPFALCKISNTEEALDGEILFDALPQRNRIIAMIESGENFDSTLSDLKKDFKITDIHTSDEWLYRFRALEILDSEWEKLLKSTEGKFLCRKESEPNDFDKYFRRLLVYFVYRHVSVAESDINLRARLAFSVLSVEVIRSLFEASYERTLATLADLARRYSSEIEYSEDNTDELIFAFESALI